MPRGRATAETPENNCGKTFDQCSVSSLSTKLKSWGKKELMHCLGKDSNLHPSALCGVIYHRDDDWSGDRNQGSWQSLTPNVSRNYSGHLCERIHDGSWTHFMSCEHSRQVSVRVTQYKDCRLTLYQLSYRDLGCVYRKERHFCERKLHHTFCYGISIS